MEKNGGSASVDARRGGYEAPEVERVLDAEELAREAHYAGSPAPISQ